MTPKRIQLRRTKGFSLQAESAKLNGLPAVKVTRPGTWGNPFKVGMRVMRGDPSRRGPLAMVWCQCLTDFHDPRLTLLETPEQCIEWYRWLITEAIPKDMSELRGKNLACFCPLGTACHADVLLELANR